jgi:hypothetical protein
MKVQVNVSYNSGLSQAIAEGLGSTGEALEHEALHVAINNCLLRSPAYTEIIIDKLGKEMYSQNPSSKVEVKKIGS